MKFTPEVVKVKGRDELFKLAPIFRKRILDSKVLLVKGAGALSEKEFEKLCFIISNSKNDPFVSWNFGDILNLRNNEESENYIFSNERVPLHWDGAFHEVPNILGFQCVENVVKGGRTIFLDSTKVLNDLCIDTKKERFGKSITYTTEKIVHYGGSIRQKIIDIHPETRASVLRLGEEVETK